MISWITLLLIIFLYTKKIKSKSDKFYLLIGLYLFIGGAFLKLINQVEISEFIMRTSFIFWLFGLVLTFKQYKDEKTAE